MKGCMDVGIKLNIEQEEAVEAMLSGRNVFLTGEAGTGKSTVVREFLRRCGHKCLVLAPTGVAAVNAGGTTIHSQFMLRPGTQNPMKLEPLNDGMRAMVIRASKTIVVDEISMVRSDLFCAMDARLRELSGGQNRERPFGGRQIILVGDFLQLPPVIKDSKELEYLNRALGGKYAFQTDLWMAAQFENVFLKTQHRQSGDSIFRNVLNNLRKGNFEAAAKVLNNNCVYRDSLPSTPICLCTTNREVDSINAGERAKVKGDERRFHAECRGKFNESDYPTDTELALVKGARVMVLCNKRTEDGRLLYVNGDMGVVTGFSDTDDGCVYVRLDKEIEVAIEPYEWKRYEYVTREDPETHVLTVVQEEVGRFVQVPLRLAYAITVHKSQGMSLDSVDLKLGRGCFDHGQLYTALSRCRSMAGLRLDRPVRSEDLIIDKEVIDFYSDFAARKLIPVDESDDGSTPYYEEAMQFYLRRLRYGDGSKIPSKTEQGIFDFSPRVYEHPDLEKLRKIYDAGILNKYDVVVLAPFAAEYILKCGVKEDDMARISRILKKYE